MVCRKRRYPLSYHRAHSRFGASDLSYFSMGCSEAFTKQMVLISPRIERDEKSPHGGKLVVSFPLESGCDTFEVPLNPTPELVSKWEL